MNGLLGESWDDPRTMAALAMAQGLLGGGSSMQRLAGGLQGYQGAMSASKREEEEKKRRALQEQMMQLQLQNAQQQRAAQEAAQMKQQGIESAYRSAFESPATQAMAGGGGPTMANAGAMQGMQPRINQQKLLQQLQQVDPMAAFQMMQPKPDDLMTVAPGATVFNKTAGKTVFTAPGAEPKAPASVQEYEYAKQQGYQGTFQQFQTELKRAGATSVRVDTGQRGLDNTLKLRGDFRSEPVYKAQQEMQSAYSQIRQALGQASPAGDLAGATKIMKLLDPGSVVRESELGMAMAASGLMDRVENYAQNIMSGTKLTPTQRKDFQTLADALYGESVKSYNAKRQEYQGIAERNGLSVPDVLGPVSSMPSSGGVDDLVNKYRSK